MTVTVAAISFDAASARACSSEPYLASVCTTTASYCPRGYIVAEGQILNISQNTSLFSLMGTVYGGDGRTTFALPDLRERSITRAGINLPGKTALAPAPKLLNCIATQGLFPPRN
ncbi:MAG: phage tail protein [Zetaproteobacteria bacterium CG_4_9_14_3_um_filter_53_7]|nr:MAG: phage tail protein [Zetaproteobacteria bacterium CG_4_9_14_3_um_filter_53_7]